ncbi:MAG: glycerophosphodiester phosphodiesterase [Methanophagales archaeon]|nr:glycerophosphodiester phosphodiesterase [Methanophagales archaeon]
MRIIAHRGARLEEPENTLRAVKRAFECGADAVEIDARLSKDHEIVAIHDDTLERTTNGSGKVGEKTLNYLRSLDAGKGEQIPVLSEVLLLAQTRGIEVVIELKEVDMEKPVLQDIAEAELEKSVTISSFFHHSLLKIKELAPAIRTGVILSSLPVYPVKLALDAKADCIFQKYPRLTREYIEEASRNEIAIYPWTINTIEDFEKVRELGVPGLVTDDPCLFKSLCSEKEGGKNGAC